MKASNKLTLYILVAMLLGAIAGYIVFTNSAPDFAKSFSTNIKLLTTIFLRLVQMIIAPLVFSTLVVGIAKLGDLKTVGRVGSKALLWFISASLMSLLLGMFLVNTLKPGEGFNRTDANAASIKDIQGNTQVFTLQHFVEHVVPKSLIEAMAGNEILQIVIFSIFFGVATAALGDYGKVVVKALDAVSHVILKMGQSRVFYTMSTDGLLPKIFSDLHPKFRTPYKSNIVLFVFVGLFAAFVPGTVAGDLTSIGTLFAFVLVCIGVMILRKKDPGLHRPFKTPLVPLVPILGMIVCGAMIVSLPNQTLLSAFIWMIVGLLVYFGYSQRNSKLRNPSDIIPKASDFE